MRSITVCSNGVWMRAVALFGGQGGTYTVDPRRG
jgi:hypothetical protein